MYWIYSRHSSLPFLCPCHSNSPHGKNLTLPHFLSTPWISLSQYSVDLSPLMSWLFLIWAVDPSPFYKPSKASTSSNLFHLSRRWGRRRRSPRQRRQLRHRLRWQRRRNRPFAEASETERRGECDATFRLRFFNNFPSSEASNESLLVAVLAMIFLRKGINARILSSVCVIFSKCSLIMSCSISNNWLSTPIIQCKSGIM